MSIHAELLDAYSEGMLNLKTSALSPDGNVHCNSASGFSSTLVELDLEGNYTQEGGGRAMAESLHLNTTHRALNLADNRLEDGGGRGLADTLGLNTTLTWLNLCQDWSLNPKTLNPRKFTNSEL